MGSGKKPRATDPRKPSARKARGRQAGRSTAHGHRHRLACPFYVKYKCSCHATGLETNARVVEHLKRSHGPPDGIEVIIPEPTDTGPPSPSAALEVRRVTQEQLTKISELPRDKNVQRKWEMIYHIIFPHDESVKATFVPKVEQLHACARNPPDWVISELMKKGESRAEAHLLMKKFLTFYEIVGRGPTLSSSTLSPPPTQLEQSTTATDSIEDEPSSGMEGMEDIDFTMNPAGEPYCSAVDETMGVYGDPSDFDFDIAHLPGLDSSDDFLDVSIGMKDVL